MVAITGGASGIGKGLAQKIALEHNAIVCILDINQVVFYSIIHLNYGVCILYFEKFKMHNYVFES